MTDTEKRKTDLLSSGTHMEFAWAVMHNGMGYRCGYIRLPEGHPWFGKDDSDYDNNFDPDVHGGITYGINYRPGEDPDGFWWIGFDCAHAGDAQDPLFTYVYDLSNYDRGVIRTQEYVEGECRSLCRQAADVKLSKNINEVEIKFPDDRTDLIKKAADFEETCVSVGGMLDGVRDREDREIANAAISYIKARRNYDKYGGGDTGRRMLAEKLEALDDLIEK